MPPAPHGLELLSNQVLNKGTAFTDDERAAFGLHGLLPSHVETLDEQVVRAYGAFQHKEDPLERHIYLRALQDTNEVLFYRLLLDHIEEMAPIVYTPVVALGCQQFSHIYRRPRGLFISYPFRDSISALLRNRPNADVDVIVVTDGERILGIGDQGVGGLGIPIGKLSLYTLIGGIHPARTLPIVLDVGTNNAELLRDPQYLGWRHERITGQAYYNFVDQFVTAVRHELPSTCLQWEDFAKPHARPILDRYRDQLLTFNDDIQGTAAVTLGTILSAVKAARQNVKDIQVVIFGAGAASIGVADYLCDMLVSAGLSLSEARGRFSIVNSGGLLHTGRTDLSSEQVVYAQPLDRVRSWANPSGTIGLAEVIAKTSASVLIGLSTVSGAFTEPIIREMARKTARPIILPLSNPTEKCEAKPANLLQWTEGRALVATGSPFPPVDYNGRRIAIAQCNNVYVFPAVGLGAVASRANRITDAILQAAARTLAEHSPALADTNAALLPPLAGVRNTAFALAVAVAAEAQRSGVAPSSSHDDLVRRVRQTQWLPQYPSPQAAP